MTTRSALPVAEVLVRRMAEVAIENEAYFCELDSIVGDGDFGFSLARGFEKLLESWGDLEYNDVSGLLIKSAMVLSGRIGGTSGPIWGTAFLRTGAALKETPEPSGADIVSALRAGIEGIKQRGKAELGDKTLLDSLVPAVDRLADCLNTNQRPGVALAAAAAVGREAADATHGMVAKRGRAAYSGDRSRDSKDAGAVAVAVILEALSATLNETPTI